MQKSAHSSGSKNRSNFRRSDRPTSRGKSTRRFSNSNSSKGFGSQRSGDSDSGNRFRFRSRSRKPSRGYGAKIHESKFIKAAAIKTVEEDYKVTHKFEDFNLAKPIISNLTAKGFTVPTPIQDQSIKSILQGKDLIGLANTGTGKTAAFLLPLIDKIYRNRQEKVLVVVPTRELALQIADELRKFSNGMSIYSALTIGGTDMRKQMHTLQRPYSFLIATPGRLKDMMERGKVELSQFGNVVLDEVDRMLDMGFIDEVKYFMKYLPNERQTLVFSATMPSKIEKLVQDFTKSPVTVSVRTSETTDTVEQNIIRVTDSNKKFDQLEELLKGEGFDRVLIFVRTKRWADRLKSRLEEAKFTADSIHGDKRQRQRERAIENFKKGRVKVLVATDVAARGLDISGVTHVINYDAPENFEDYTHRIGRTGRGGAKGFAFTFVE